MVSYIAASKLDAQGYFKGIHNTRMRCYRFNETQVNL